MTCDVDQLFFCHFINLSLFLTFFLFLFKSCIFIVCFQFIISRVANSQNLPVDEMLKNLQEKLESDIQDIKGELKNIPEMEGKCKDIKSNQVKITEQLDEIIKIQNMIGGHLLTLNSQAYAGKE